MDPRGDVLAYESRGGPGSRNRESDATYRLVSWIRRFWRVTSIATFRIKYRYPVHPCSIGDTMELPLRFTVSPLQSSPFISLFSLSGLLQHCSSASKTVTWSAYSTKCAWNTLAANRLLNGSQMTVISDSRHTYRTPPPYTDAPSR